MAPSSELHLLLRWIQQQPRHGSLRPFLVDELKTGTTSERLREALRFRGWAPAREDEDARGLEREYAEALGQGIRWVALGDPDYPSQLLECIDPPLLLSVLGAPEALWERGLSVVGSREPGRESLQWMEMELSRFLKRHQPTVISGGARGVDQKAHSVALRARCPTIAFLPSGLLAPYPADLSRWFGEIVEGGGAVVSEYPLYMPMRKAHFHHRNRLIAALGKAVLVVEAKTFSGSLITATRAAEIGRPIFALPGAPWDPRFSGNLQLVMEGANWVMGAEDLSLFWQAESFPI